METKESEDESRYEESYKNQSTALMMRIRKFKMKEVLTWQLAKTLAMGQGLAVLICGTAISSQYLATKFHVNTPMLQSLLNYTLLCATYTTMLLCRTGDGNIFQILRSRWWKYLLLGLVDVEANYAVVKAYQYTTLTSIQLLDCFVVPVLMLLSWWVLKTRYRLVHYVAVCICLLGVGAMVGADLLAGRDQGSTSNILLGDGLVLISATLYAVSNVCQEYTVKNLSREEFLGMIGLFGTVISTVQMVILERNEVTNIQWSWEVGLLFAAFALCMYTLYSCMPIVVRLSSATSVNLSLLTADLFSLFCGIFLFRYHFSGLYLVSLVVILIGFITYNVVPTPTAPTDPSSSSSSSSSSICEEGQCDVASQNEMTKQELAVKITTEEGRGDEEEQSADEEKKNGWKEEKNRRWKKRRATGPPQRLEGQNDVVVVRHSTKM
ncbi:solute carrier family 35 member F2-like [Solea senegalensis]|uniref:Solute carrier family 35 member F2-like n=1 Tax=Solea senegalensis TaxID=28829 RepID=A0AAV6PF67_SOLSE|nr:solute carrier family 35 member F2-like [Solea senegalensis]KAG7459176.1 solute carrier family 35 member F2-like [Solea senegalensis]